MKVIGFIGPSGTGKSHRSTWVARERGIDYIIDDGILIKSNQVIAGFSAKKEKTKIASIKCALFTNNEHANNVKNTIKENDPDSILILGTSENMVEMITKRLDLPEITEKIFIHEVASEFEIKQALSTRKEQGKHVIPVPTFELKKEFSGYFLDPLQIFRRKGKGNYQLVAEKSVVRPTFSYLGNYTISDYTIYQIIEYIASSIEGVYKISRFRVDKRSEGIYIEMDLILVYGYIIKDLLREAQNIIKSSVEKLTAINIISINIEAKNLVVQKNKKIT